MERASTGRRLDSSWEVPVTAIAGPTRVPLARSTTSKERVHCFRLPFTLPSTAWVTPRIEGSRLASAWVRRKFGLFNSLSAWPPASQRGVLPSSPWPATIKCSQREQPAPKLTAAASVPGAGTGSQTRTPGPLSNCFSRLMSGSAFSEDPPGTAADFGAGFFPLGRVGAAFAGRGPILPHRITVAIVSDPSAWIRCAILFAFRLTDICDVNATLVFMVTSQDLKIPFGVERNGSESRKRGCWLGVNQDGRRYRERRGLRR